MALHGSLLTMPLADLLSWVKTTSRSGLLTVFRDSNEWELVVGRGAVIGYSGPELRDNLGYIIVTSGLLSEDDLRIAYQYQRHHKISLQRALLQKGLLTPEALQACLRELATESIYDLFLDLPGEFVFSERSDSGLGIDLDDANDERLALELDINHLLMEGARRQDEWIHIRDRFPHDDLVVSIVDAKLPDFESLGVRERRILASLSAGQSLSDLCFELRAPIPSVLRILAHFEDRGAVKIKPLTEGAHEGGVGADRIGTLVQQASLLRASGQFNEAIALLEVAVRMRPDADAARLALKDALEEQIRDFYSMLPPVKVPVLVADDERLSRLRLRPEERFLIDRLAAHMDIGSLIMVSSLNERETLKLLRKLLHSHVIELQ